MPSSSSSLSPLPILAGSAACTCNHHKIMAAEIIGARLGRVDRGDHLSGSYLPGLEGCRLSLAAAAVASPSDPVSVELPAPSSLSSPASSAEGARGGGESVGDESRTRHLLSHTANSGEQEHGPPSKLTTQLHRRLCRVSCASSAAVEASSVCY